MKQCICLQLRDAEGKLLLQMRDNTPGIQHPLLWDFFGGGVEEGEQPEAAAAREMAEELEMRADPAAFVRVDTYVRNGAKGEVEEILLRLDRPIDWGDFRVREGAGAGFFRKEDILLIPHSPVVRDFLSRESL